MRHIYAFNGFDLSEDLLLGLGSGVSFSYWHFKGQPPFFGGRGLPRPGLEELAGQRTGVVIQSHSTTSRAKAKMVLLKMISAGQPVMLQVDMGYLPYFCFGGEEYHFGGHAIVVCGYDPRSDQVLIADREEELHTVAMGELENARASAYKPFPPKNRWYTFDFNRKRSPTPEEVGRAIQEQVDSMLHPPISNLGIKGIRKAAKLVPDWAQSMSEKELRWTLFNIYIFISQVGGSGGGAFRYMFSRFLKEAAQIQGNPELQDCAQEFEHIGDKWEELGIWFRQTSQAANPAQQLGDCVLPLNLLAEMEERSWKRLLDCAAA